MDTDAAFADLLRRACANDEQAATELCRSYEPELRRFLRFRMTDPGLRRFLDSLDICQSVRAAFFVHLQAGELEVASPRQLHRLLAVMAQNKPPELGQASVSCWWHDPLLEPEVRLKPAVGVKEPPEAADTRHFPFKLPDAIKEAPAAVPATPPMARVEKP
jgi:hypothetical protein